MIAQAKHEPRGPEQRKMWDYMTSVTSFSHDALKKATGVSDFKRTNYVGQLKAIQVLRDVGWEDGKKLFTVHSDVAISDMTGDRRRSIEGKIWTAIRSMRKFQPEDIVSVLEADEPAITMDRVRKYVTVLLEAGYLAVISPAKPGKRSGRYRLSNNTGPLPPMVKKMSVIIDTNRERVMHVKGARI